MKKYNSKSLSILLGLGDHPDNFIPVDIVPSSFLMNDNNIARMLLYPDEFGRVPSLVSLQNNDSFPIEVQKFINSLLREYPQVFKGFSTDSDAFDFIKSRYAQYGQERDSYLNSLTSILEDYENELSKQSSDSSSSE